MSLPGRGSDRTRSISLLLSMLAAFAVACITYQSILPYFFTGTDTLTLIETSRITCLDDFKRLVTEPLMPGTAFIEIARFFRPLTALSYSLDYAAWGLHPWGYHLTNLLLNALVAALVVLVLFELSDKDLSFACLGGIIFAIHPILVESVPATDRRQDMLAAVFVLLSLALLLRYRRPGTGKRLVLAFSVVSYVLALAAKEIAIIVPPLVFARFFLFTNEKGFRKRFLCSCAGTSPYLCATVVYLMWRTLVLRGIGGYVRTDGPMQVESTYVVNVLYNYVTDLVYPVDALNLEEGPLGYWLIVVILVVVVGYMANWLRSTHGRHPTEDCGSCRALMLYFLIWLTLPLMVFLVTQTFAHRSMYIPAIPFGAMVAYPLVQSVRSLFSFMTAEQPTASLHSRTWTQMPKSRLVVAATGTVFVIYAIAYSPLIRHYGQWRDSARIAFLVLTQLSSEVAKVSTDYRIEVYDLPDRIRSYEKKTPRAKEVNYLRDYSIQSWLNLHYPDKVGTIIVRSRLWPWEFSGSLRVGLVRLSQRNLVAFVEMGAKNTQTNIAAR